MFETDRVPAEWVSRCNRMDEVWVPSRFHLETFQRSGVAAAKLVVIHQPLDTQLFAPQNTASTERHFVFLSVFKWELRKGWDLLLTAFLTEFALDERISLRIITQPHVRYCLYGLVRSRAHPSLTPGATVPSSRQPITRFTTKLARSCSPRSVPKPRLDSIGSSTFSNAVSRIETCRWNMPRPTPSCCRLVARAGAGRTWRL